MAINPNEIIPYRILIKKYPISPYTASIYNKIITTVSIVNYIINSKNSKDSSFLKLKINEKFKCISTLIDKIVDDDFFSIRLYSSVYFGFINKYLRKEKVLEEFRKYKGFTLAQIQSWIYYLHLSLSININVKDDIVVYKGVNMQFPPEINRFYILFLRISFNNNK